jgi:hypothetical protein
MAFNVVLLNLKATMAKYQIIEQKLKKMRMANAEVANLLMSTGWSVSNVTHPVAKSMIQEGISKIFTEMFNINNRIQSSILMFELKTYKFAVCSSAQ